MIYRERDAYGRVTERSCTGRDAELAMNEFFDGSVKTLTKQFDNKPVNDAIRNAVQTNLVTGLKGALVEKLNENA